MNASSQLKGPSFVGIGAQRAGTSWLYNCLLEHPEVYMPQKEVHYFDKLHKTHDINWYTNLFNNTSDKQVTGEITPDYMYHQDTIRALHQNFPDTKLIIILRNPIERSYSAFNLFRAHGRFKNMTFDEALKSEPFLLEQSLYYEQLENVFRFFNKEQVLIKFYEDITDKPKAFYLSVCEFLKIDPNFQPRSLTVIKNSSAMSSVQSRFNFPAMQRKIEASIFRKTFQFFKTTKTANLIKLKLVTKKSNIQVSSRTKKTVMNDIEELERILELSLTQWKI
jgi:hypothetical protein